jgi:ankyrin repeat protein
LTRAPSPRMAIAAGQRQDQTTAPLGQMGGAVQGLGNDQQAHNSFPSIQVQENAPGPISASPHDQQARFLLAWILDGCVNPNSHDYLSTITSRLDSIIIERQEGDIAKNLQSFFGSSAFEITLQLLRYSIYLSSNNLLPECYPDELLELVVQSGHFTAIENLIKLRTATTEIFASNIFLSAIRIGYPPTVQALIALGIDINIPGGCREKNMALSVAVKDSIKQRISGEEEEFPLVMILLNAGADINAKSGRNNTSPLQEAISEKHVQLVQILLNAGAILDVPANEPDLLYTALLKAARGGDSKLVEKLLDMLTRPSMITLLQDAAMAASFEDTDTVEALLDGGADVDAPASVIYEPARKVAVKSDNWHHLQSAIQIAASNGRTEMVQVLLDAGANVDGYFFTPEEFSIYESLFRRDVEERYCNREEYYWEDYEYDNIEDYSRECCDDDDIYLSHFYRTPLQSAVELGDEVLVRLLLLAGADIEGQGRGLTPLQLAASRNNVPASGIGGRTALQAAAESGSTGLVEILIAAGSDLNAAASPNSGYSALQAACKSNNIEVASKLISLGADINAAPCPINGQTCLQVAAWKGQPELVQILLNSGAEVNAAGAAKYGFTALQAAARAGHLSVVKMLLAAGADVHAPATERGYSAISAAVMRNDLEMVQLFLKAAGPHGNADPLPPIFRASRKGATEIVQCLIRAGANINALRTDMPSSGYGYPCTALEAALCRGHYHVFEMLLDAGTDFNGQVPSLRAALGAASTAWTYGLGPTERDIAHKLLNTGADVNRAFSSDGMPLHRAVNSCRFDRHLVQMLLDAGADVNGRAPDGNTALGIAVPWGNIDLIEVLLNAGADIEAYAPTDKSRTALQDAAQRGNTIVVRFLLERGANCNASAADSKGATALQAAAIGGNLQITLMLLKAGADINAAAAKSNGRSALEAAAEHGRLDILSLLLKNDTDADGLECRCKDAAKLAEKEGHIFISRMLRAYKEG